MSISSLKEAVDTEERIVGSLRPQLVINLSTLAKEEAAAAALALSLPVGVAGRLAGLRRVSASLAAETRRALAEIDCFSAEAGVFRSCLSEELAPPGRLIDSLWASLTGLKLLRQRLSQFAREVSLARQSLAEDARRMKPVAAGQSSGPMPTVLKPAEKEELNDSLNKFHREFEARLGRLEMANYQFRPSESRTSEPRPTESRASEPRDREEEPGRRIDLQLEFLAENLAVLRNQAVASESQNFRNSLQTHRDQIDLLKTEVQNLTLALKTLQITSEYQTKAQSQAQAELQSQIQSKVLSLSEEQRLFEEKKVEAAARGAAAGAAALFSAELLAKLAEIKSQSIPTPPLNTLRSKTRKSLISRDKLFSPGDPQRLHGNNSLNQRSLSSLGNANVSPSLLSMNTEDISELSLH